MAKVMEYTTKAGVKIEFYDDAYAGCSEAELERRRKEIQRTAWHCAKTLAAIRAGKGNESCQAEKKDIWNERPPR